MSKRNKSREKCLGKYAKVKLRKNRDEGVYVCVCWCEKKDVVEKKAIRNII